MTTNLHYLIAGMAVLLVVLWQYSHQRQMDDRNSLMFRRLPGSRWLKSKTTTAEAAIGFMSGLMGQIAAEHQSGNPKKNLPARELIGFGKDDLVYIEQTVVAHLAKS